MFNEISKRIRAHVLTYRQKSFQLFNEKLLVELITLQFGYRLTVLSLRSKREHQFIFSSNSSSFLFKRNQMAFSYTFPITWITVTPCIDEVNYFRSAQTHVKKYSGGFGFWLIWRPYKGYGLSLMSQLNSHRNSTGLGEAQAKVHIECVSGCFTVIAESVQVHIMRKVLFLS